MAIPERVRSLSGGKWRIEALSGGAGELHATDVSAERLVRIHVVDAPALVLGSSQSAKRLGHQEGLEVARRRSGGGAVWLAPHEQVWVDVVLPAGDSLWQDDVRRSALWLGEVWASICDPGATVWRGPMRDQAASAVACFAGVGSGEVTLAGSKLVGISQRRTATLARFQCVAYLRWDPHPFVEVLDPGDPQVLEALSHRVATLGVGVHDGEVAMWDVVGRLLNAMP